MKVVDHHDQLITDVTLDNEDVFFKVLKMANSSGNREALCHCTGSSANPCFVPQTLNFSLSLSQTWTEDQQERESYQTRREDFYNLPKERLRNYFLTKPISLKTTKGEE